jgi:hypothetical protein
MTYHSLLHFLNIRCPSIPPYWNFIYLPYTPSWKASSGPILGLAILLERRTLMFNYSN